MWDCPLLIERVFFCLHKGAGICHRTLGGGLQLNEYLCYQYRAVNIYSATRRKNINNTIRKIPTYGKIGLVIVLMKFVWGLDRWNE